MSHQHAVADFQRETYPAYESKLEDGYVQGYDPMSLAAPHSSLIRNSTGIGMGLVLSILPAIGILIWGLGVMAYPYGSAGDQDFNMWIIVGIAAVIAITIAGFGLIRYGRRYYRQFEKRQKQQREAYAQQRRLDAGSRTEVRTVDNGVAHDGAAHGRATHGYAEPVDAKDL